MYPHKLILINTISADYFWELFGQSVEYAILHSRQFYGYVGKNSTHLRPKPTPRSIGLDGTLHVANFFLTKGWGRSFTRSFFNNVKTKKFKILCHLIFRLVMYKMPKNRRPDVYSPIGHLEIKRELQTRKTSHKDLIYNLKNTLNKVIVWSIDRLIDQLIDWMSE